jgi:predicted outer membrane repeat protein
LVCWEKEPVYNLISCLSFPVVALKFIFAQIQIMGKYLMLLLVGCSFVMQGFASHITVSGSVSGNWDADTVFVSDNIQVPSGQVLNIAPGTLVQFLGHYRFRIDGQVLAQGEENDSIRFSVNDTTGLANYETGAGSWKSLWFYHLGPTNDSTIFEYCHFEYGKAAHEADTADWYGGAVCVREFSRLRFSHCSFNNSRAYKNGGAIYARLANFKVDHCSFRNNDCGQASLYGYGGGLCLEYSDAMIHRNYFTLNSSTGVGGGLSWEYSDPSVIANHFYDNYSALGGGFVCLRSNGTSPIVNNLVEANSSLFFGGGIAVLETTMPFTNNTVVANFSGAGGGLYFNAGSFSVFKNCVVWDNYDLGGGGPQVYIWDTFSAPEFYYCDVEGGVEQFGGTGGGSGGFIGIYENCYETDPNFTGSGDHPYQPLQNSICINNGTPDTTGLFLPETDFAGNARIMNYYVDIGAYETLVITSEMEKSDITGRTTVSPNPFSSEVKIDFCLDETTPVQIILLNAHGMVLRQLEKAVLSPGRHQYKWNIRSKDSNESADGFFILKIVRVQQEETFKLLHTRVK